MAGLPNPVIRGQDRLSEQPQTPSWHEFVLVDNSKPLARAAFIIRSRNSLIITPSHLFPRLYKLVADTNNLTINNTQSAVLIVAIDTKFPVQDC